MPHASSLISRMIMSAAQSAPTADAASDSSARRVLSAPSLYPQMCAALWASLSSTLPRSPCRNEPDDTRQESHSISGGKSSRYDLRQRRQLLDGSADRVQSKSSACWPSSARMTRVHPTPARGLRPPQASRRGRATLLPFFDPARNGVARHCEGAREAAQTAALVVGAKYLFARFLRVSVAARLLSAALSAIAAEVALATIGSQAITHQPLALAMLTSQGNSDHC